MLLVIDAGNTNIVFAVHDCGFQPRCALEDDNGAEPRIDKLKLSLFKRAAEGGAFNIADYGVILVSGYGMEPPPYIRQQYEGEED